MSFRFTNKILLSLAEQEKEHGYFVLAALQDLHSIREVNKFHRVPSQLKGARLLCFGNCHFTNGEPFMEAY
jgi:hypothetical protein